MRSWALEGTCLRSCLCEGTVFICFGPCLPKRRSAQTPLVRGVPGAQSWLRQRPTSEPCVQPYTKQQATPQHARAASGYPVRTSAAAQRMRSQRAQVRRAPPRIGAPRTLTIVHTLGGSEQVPDRMAVEQGRRGLRSGCPERSSLEGILSASLPAWPFPGRIAFHLASLSIRGVRVGSIGCDAKHGPGEACCWSIHLGHGL